MIFSEDELNFLFSSVSLGSRLREEWVLSVSVGLMTADPIFTIALFTWS